MESEQIPFEDGHDRLPGSDEDNSSAEENNTQVNTSSSTPRTKEQKAFKCDTCTYSSKFKSNLMRHIRLKHQDDITCKECGKSFDSETSLGEHQRNHNKEYFCELCGKRYTSRKGIRVHKLNVHKEMKGKHTCIFCDKTFSELSHYTGHVNKHHGLRPFECSKCKQNFSYKSNLQRHEKTCKGNDKFTCDVCKNVFTSLAVLKEHKAGKHASTKRYTCKCGQLFRWRSALGKHRKNCNIN